MKNNQANRLTLPIALSLLWLFFIPLSHSTESTYLKTAILFVAYDQGESNAFLRIQERLKDAGIPYRILAMGRAAEVFEDDPALIRVAELTRNDTLYNNRNQPLDQRLVYQLTEMISAKIVYTGMASRAQAQIANAWERTGARVIAFYDNLEPIDTVQYVQPFLAELRYADAFHVPSARTATSFQGLARAIGADVVVTGQPVMEEWDKSYQQTNPGLLRHTLGIAPQQPVVLFAGDYSNSYPEALQTFISAADMLPDILFLVTCHPKSDGSLERRAIAESPAKNIHLLDHNVFSTATLSTIASVVIVHKSSIAQQAIYQGKPVIYVAKPDYHNLMLTEQLAIRASTPKPLALMIDAHLKGYRVPAVAEKLGIPDAPGKTIAQLMIEGLNHYDNKH